LRDATPPPPPPPPLEPLQFFCQAESEARAHGWKRWWHCRFGLKQDVLRVVIWQDIHDAFEWKHWQIRHANTQHEWANRADSKLRLTSKQYFSGDGRPTGCQPSINAWCDNRFQKWRLLSFARQTLPMEISPTVNDY